MFGFTLIVCVLICVEFTKGLFKKLSREINVGLSREINVVFCLESYR